jgi:hypothetical protein
VPWIYVFRFTSFRVMIMLAFRHKNIYSHQHNIQVLYRRSAQFFWPALKTQHKHWLVIKLKLFTGQVAMFV